MTGSCRAKECLNIDSRIRAPCIFVPNPDYIARCASFIGGQSPTKRNAQLTERNVQTGLGIRKVWKEDTNVRPGSIGRVCRIGVMEQ